MKVALIFGITGQDGSYLAEFLLDKGYKVVGVTRRVSVDTLERLKQVKNRVIIEEADMSDPFSVSNVLVKHQPHEVYNLAAQSHVATSFTQPSLTWDITGKGVLNILEAIKVNNLSCKFYQASSSEMFGRAYSTRYDSTSSKRYIYEFGPIKVGPNGIPADNWTDAFKEVKYQNEDTHMLPQSPYAIAKLAGHHLVRNYRDSYGIYGCSGILFNHESPRRGENFVTRKITKWIGENFAHLHQYGVDNIGEEVYESNCVEYPKLRLGNLKARRDWGHAKDYIKAMWLMLQQDKPDDYVISTGETHSIEEFLDSSFSFAFDNKINWRDVVYIDPKFYRPSEVDYLLGDSSKAREKLGWSPSISFKELVHEMVRNDIDEKRQKL